MINRERLIIQVDNFDKNSEAWNLVMPIENDILIMGAPQETPVELVQGKQEDENKITWELEAEGCMWSE